MQIFEITQRQQVNELVGTLAKGLGSAMANKFVSQTLPGRDLADQDDAAKASMAYGIQQRRHYARQQKDQQKKGFAQTATAAPSQVSYKGIPGMAPTTVKTPAAPTAPAAPAVPKTPAAPAATPAATAAAKPAAQSWQGTNVNVPAVLRKQAAQQTAAPAAAPATTPAATPAAKPAAPAAAAPASNIVPKPGSRIVVQHPTGGKYYKTAKGWTNEVGQAVTQPNSIADLERRADAGGREEKIPTMGTAKPMGKQMKSRRR